MPTAVSNSVFSVPLRHLWSTSFTGDQVISDGTVRGLARFVGDSPNELLRYFAVKSIPVASDWPLVLYGAPGTGKTSLAMAVLANLLNPKTNHQNGDEGSDSETVSVALEERDPKPTAIAPVFVTASDFVRRLKSAIDMDSVSDFRRRYAGGMLIDNLHVLSKHPAAQQEICYLLDQLSRLGRPFIATCEKAPASYDQFQPQLISRLEGGLCLPIHAPGVTARREIIHDLCEIYGLKITSDGIQLIAERLKVTVPKLNHFLAQLKTYTDVAEFDAPFIGKLFERFVESNSMRKTKIITQRVAAQFGLKMSDLKSNSRKLTIVLARGICIYLCRELLNISFQKIGSCFGNRDHSTIMHAYRKIKKLVEDNHDERTRKIILDLHHSLTASFSEFSFEDLENLSKTR